MPTNTYVALDKITATGSIANAEFTSIPQGYTDLVVVVAGQVSSNVSLAFQVNGDTGSNYSCTEIFGDGSTASSFRSTSNAQVTVASIGAQINSGSQWVSTLHFQNYSNTTTNKTILGRTSAAGTGVNAIVGMWRSTAAISSIKIMGYANASGFTTGTTFSLYGIAAEGAPYATGGYITSDANYYYHTFLSSGTFTPLQTLTCDVLTIAGGGGGGDFYGAGGGAGGLLSTTSASLTAKNYTVTIGGGGAGAASGTSARGSNGANSTITATSFTTLTATGGGAGGGGGSGQETGNSGGSGGGGGGAGTASGGAGNTPSTSPSQGNNGSNARNPGGGGGGGAGAVGIQATGCGGVGSSAFSSWGVATNTGDNISGTRYYAGGGGANDPAAYGGGGAPGTTPVGAANTGGGGGRQTSGVAGNGGSGIVIVRYAKA